MGTTSTALQQPGARFCYVLAIEGYPNLITDHVSTTAVATAWAASEWSACLPGLKVGGPIKRSIAPWQTELDVTSIQVSVQPDEADTFGTAVFRAKGTFNTRLTDTFLPATDGSGTINVKSTAGAGASGQVYVGKTKHTYSSKASGSFTLGAAGANSHSPFSADGGNKFAGPATHPANVNFDVSASPRVSDVSPAWIGRKVALYIHRISGDTLDVLAQAKLEFAGVIRNLADSEDGSTVLEIEDMLALVRDAVILKDQWVGYVKEGVQLVAGTRFRAYEIEDGVGGKTSNDLVVVASGAAGANQIDADIYTVAEFASAVDAWLASETAATRLDGNWDVSIPQVSEAGYRFQIGATFSSGTTRRIWMLCSTYSVWDVLGFGKGDGAGGVGLASPFKLTDGDFWLVQGWGENDSLRSVITSGRAPYRAKFLQNEEQTNGSLADVVVELDTSTGTFFNQRTYLPPALRAKTTSGESWGIFAVGNTVYLGRMDDATHISGLMQRVGPLRYVDSRDEAPDDGLSYDAEEDKLPIRQVLMLDGSFTDIVTKLFASLGGTSGVNHATFDVFDWGAGVPWSLLGDNWLNSCYALEHASHTRNITTLVTEPTRLLDLLVPELALRFAWIVWKDEGYQIRTLATPSSLTADWTLDETNKAEPVGTMAAGRTTTKVTNEFLRNTIKIEYARSAAGKYRRTLLVKDQDSITEYGESKAVTISAVNSYGREASVGAQVQELAASLVSRVFPRFAKPLKTLRRSIAPTLFDIVPGDTVSISDDFARDPTSGARGLSSRAGTVMSISYDRGANGGKLFGEVEVMLSDEDRHYPMSPAAEVDATYSGALHGRTFTNGYAATAAGGPALILKAHAYSRSSDTADVNRFTATDKLRLVRLDSSSGDAWDVTIASVVAADNVLVLSADLAAPAFTAGATERYRLQSQDYTSCTAAQKLKAFQADDADSYIQDVADPNVYGEQDWQAFGGATLTELPILPVSAEYWGDGKPFHPGLLHDAAVMQNNLVNYRTAPNAPVMVQTPMTASINAWLPVMSFWFALGPAIPEGLVRKIYLAPFFKSDAIGNTASVRVTSSLLPPKSDALNSVMGFSGATQQVTFTTNSTAYAEGTEQALIPVRGSGGIGGTWLTVELKASLGVGGVAYCYGLSRLYLGPVEAY